MNVFTDIDNLPRFRNAVVTIGTFDGVHLGHQEIISCLKSEVKRVDGESVIITFHPHPRKIVQNKPEKIQLLTTMEERAELLRASGIDHLVVVPFTKAFSEQDPAHYVEKFLFEKCRPAVVIIGYDHRFGKARQGDYKLLEAYSAKGLFELKEISQHLISNSTVSSTRIRTALLEGDVALANRLLGYRFFFEGIVTRGDQRGRTIGFPTANLQVLNEDKITPANGVYAVRVRENRNGKFHDGMMNIGVRPTVDGSKQTIEVHLFDFSEDIYGTTIRVYLEAYIRPEQKFSGLPELKARLALDEEEARRILSR